MLRHGSVSRHGDQGASGRQPPFPNGSAMCCMASYRYAAAAVKYAAFVLSSSLPPSINSPFVFIESGHPCAPSRRRCNTLTKAALFFVTVRHKQNGGASTTFKLQRLASSLLSRCCFKIFLLLLLGSASAAPQGNDLFGQKSLLVVSLQGTLLFYSLSGVLFQNR